MASDSFVFNSDYPIDKIVWMEEGELTTDAYGSAEADIAYGLDSQLYVQGIWSEDNWATTYVIGSNILNNRGETIAYTSATADDEEVGLYFALYGNNYTPRPNVHIKYRIWGVFYEADSIDVEAPMTRPKSKNRYILNSDYNYPQLYKEGIADATHQKVEVVHGLGYIPFVDIWEGTYDDYYQKWSWAYGALQGFGSTVGGLPNITIDSTKIVFDTDPDWGWNKYYYRIYK